VDCFSFSKDSTKTEAKVELEFPRLHQLFLLRKYVCASRSRWYHLVVTNIAMENPNQKWRFLAGKIIYFYGPSIPWLCLTMVISTRSPGSLWANVLGLASNPILMYEMFESHHPDMVPPLAASQKICRKSHPPWFRGQVSYRRITTQWSHGDYFFDQSVGANSLSFKSMDWFKGKSTGNHGFYHQI